MSRQGLRKISECLSLNPLPKDGGNQAGPILLAILQLYRKPLLINIVIDRLESPDLRLLQVKPLFNHPQHQLLVILILIEFAKFTLGFVQAGLFQLHIGGNADQLPGVPVSLDGVPVRVVGLPQKVPQAGCDCPRSVESRWEVQDRHKIAEVVAEYHVVHHAAVGRGLAFIVLVISGIWIVG
jgi:hypothetical protein